VACYALLSLAASLPCRATNLAIVGTPSFTLTGSNYSLGTSVQNVDPTPSNPVQWELWAFTAPYAGGPLNGFRLTTDLFGPSPLGAGIIRTRAAAGSLLAPPGGGTWHIAVVWTENDGSPTNNGFSPRAWFNFGTRTFASTGPNYTALWWNPLESGWGLNVNHQGAIVFATLFTYAENGQPMWLVGPSLGLQPGGGYSGPIYRTTGPAFNAVPWTAISFSEVGSMTLAFSAANRGTLTYTFNGTSVTKAIEPQVFGPPTTCTTTTAGRAGATNYQDLWWNPQESGWGINLTHQGNVIFATLFTYSSNGQGEWYVGPSLTRQPNGSFLGEIYRTNGPAFNATPWPSIGFAQVGMMAIAFSNGETGTLSYSVGGASVTKTIQRQVFSSPTPVCQ
jgi:hypothetical protein